MVPLEQTEADLTLVSYKYRIRDSDGLIDTLLWFIHPASHRQDDYYIGPLFRGFGT